MRTRLVLLISTLLLAAQLFWPTPHAQAATSEKGLALSPPRQFSETEAGVSSTGTVVVSNFTDQPMNVTLSVEEFTVSNYSYTFSFAEPKEPFVSLSSPYVSLQPGESHKVIYDITPPSSAPPGGRYMTIVASTVMQIDGAPHTIEVASPLYITIKGALYYTNSLEASSVSKLAVGNSIPYRLDIKSRGNVHFPVYVSSRLEGMFGRYTGTDTTHLLLPGSTRRIEAAIPSPLLPGIYQLTYGYRTDHTEPIAVTTYVLYLPIWWWATLPFGAWAVVLIVKRVKKHRFKITDSRRPPDMRQT